MVVESNDIKLGDFNVSNICLHQSDQSESSLNYLHSLISCIAADVQASRHKVAAIAIVVIVHYIRMLYTDNL